MYSNSNPTHKETCPQIIFPQNEKPTNPITTTTLKSCGQTSPIKNPPLSCNIFSEKSHLQWPFKVNFPGWKKPTNEWVNWVENISAKHAKVWLQTGICDAILSSLNEIKFNPEIVLALTEYWCPKTNTFMFPWGESTITLEDVMILAGLPVIGQSVNIPILDDSMKVLEEKLVKVRSFVSKNSAAKRASYSSWIKYFNEELEEESKSSLEHVGFLAYWLSKFVFPDLDERTIGKHVFSIAVMLSQGVKIALAPAVLSCLYQNLTFLSQHIADCDANKKEISVPGPFQIVCLWALERFPSLGSKLSKPLSLGQPRIARWDKVGFKMSLVDVRLVLRSEGSFVSRPYALDLENWRVPSFYRLNEMKVPDCSALDDDGELMSFCACLRPQQLVGIDCNEMYRPQRVARQFGYDKEFPGEIEFSSASVSEIVRMFVSLGSLESGVPQEDSKCSKESKCDDHSDEIEAEGMKKPDNDETKPMLESDVVKSELNCGGDCLSNVVVSSSTPPSEVFDDSSDNNGRKRKLCTGKQVRSRHDIIFLDLDEEEVENVGQKGDDHSSSTSAKEAEKRVGGSADCPVYVSDHCRKMSTKGRKSGISLENPIDVESYFL